MYQHILTSSLFIFVDMLNLDCVASASVRPSRSSCRRGRLRRTAARSSQSATCELMNTLPNHFFEDQRILINLDSCSSPSSSPLLVLPAGPLRHDVSQFDPVQPDISDDLLSAPRGLDVLSLSSDPVELVPDVDICDDVEVLDWVPDAEVLDFVIESQSPGVSVPVVPLSSNRRDLPYASGVGRKFFASAYCHATVSARASACKVLGAAILTCEGEVQEAKRLHLPIESLTSRCALSADFLVPSTSLEVQYRPFSSLVRH